MKSSEGEERKREREENPVHLILETILLSTTRAREEREREKSI